jgi:plasmid stability protein
MGSVLVRGLDRKTIERLRERARLNGRTLQQEARALLERAAETFTIREARRISERWRRRLDGRSFSDSAPLIRPRIAIHDEGGDFQLHDLAYDGARA